jgi:hypothetical protein
MLKVLIILVIIVLLSIYGYNYVFSKRQVEQSVPTDESSDNPKWWNEVISDGYIYGYGMAEATMRNIAEIRAHSNALADVAMRMSGIEKKAVIIHEDGSQETVMMRTVDQTVQGSEITKREYRIQPNGVYRVYMQIRVPIEK